MHNTMSDSHPLSAYVRATMRLQDSPRVVSHQQSEERQQDGDYTILMQTTEYTFDNGVHMVAEVEQEWSQHDTIQGDVCPPCDITYTISQAAGHTIQPPSKAFKNSCQLHFWMQAHHLHTPE